MEKALFRKIGAFQYSSEAYVVKTKLESEGIEVFIRDNYTVDSDPLVSNAIGGVKLFVRNEDFEKASTLLDEIPKHSLDDEGKMIRCPKCGAEKADFITTVKDLKSLLTFIFSLLLFVLPFYNRYKYKCGECKFEFD